MVFLKISCGDQGILLKYFQITCTLSIYTENVWLLESMLQVIYHWKVH